MEEGLFYIQYVTRFIGNCALFWGPNKGGYTCDLDAAGKYTETEAKSIVHTRNPSEEVAWPVKLVDALARRHIHNFGWEGRNTPPKPGTVVKAVLSDEKGMMEEKHVHHVDWVKRVCTECGMTLRAIADGGGEMDHGSFITVIASTLEDVMKEGKNDIK